MGLREQERTWEVCPAAKQLAPRNRADVSESVLALGVFVQCGCLQSSKSWVASLADTVSWFCGWKSDIKVLVGLFL